MSPPLSEVVEVIHGNRDFSSRLVSLVDREPGALLARIEGSAPTSERTYATVQTSEDGDIELNSDLVYCNHSCDPTVVFNMDKMEVRVLPDRPLKKADDITYFYPSTEWDMQQPFQCNCGSKRCLGIVRGARHLAPIQLRQYWLNPHIKRLLADREAGGKDSMAIDNCPRRGMED